ncbi:hypothetical protein Glove_423g25 [Diversispora epigaea]|uniref:Uncharacterized protein n=1 Tax=Diversispora epigaea TaxID=1348612 RepID=A0A397GUQ8_9GLOM|nr:hypothetical protein Glove_423g25 [Diversispora epigaea]
MITSGDISITRKLRDTLSVTMSPLETVESLRVYEREPGEAQKFLDRIGHNLRWPASMPNFMRSCLLDHFFRRVVPAKAVHAQYSNDKFIISIRDNNDSSLIGNETVHQRKGELSFQNSRHELFSTTFLNDLSP